MPPREPEVLASRWRLDDLLAGTREVEVHAATDTDAGADAVVVLWAEDPGPSGREAEGDDIVLLDSGVHDGIWFAAYAGSGGAPLSPAAKAALGASFVPADHVDEPVPPPPVAEATAAMPVAAAGRGRGRIAAGAAGLLVLLAVAGLLLGRSGDGSRGVDDEPRATERIEEPLRGALRELRAAAGAEGRTEVAAVEEAVSRRDWPETERALRRVRRLDRPGTGGRPGRIGIAVDRVRAALPLQGARADGALVPAPCETTTTTSSTTTTLSTSSTSSTSSSTTVTPADGATTTTVPCEPPPTTTTTVARSTTSTTTDRSSPSTSTSSTTARPSTSSSSTTTSTTSPSSTTTTSTSSPSTTSTTPTTTAP